MRALLASLSLAALSLSWACTLLLPAEDQCTAASDCDRRGGALAGRACVDGVCVASQADAALPSPPPDASDAGGDAAPGPFACKDTPKPLADPSRGATLLQPIYNVVSGAPLVNVAAKLCSRVDPNCTSPAATLTSDAQGVLSARVFVGFEGFFEVKGAEVASSLIMSNPPIFGDSQRPAVPIPTKAVIEFYAQQVTGAPLDATLGQLLVRATDCNFVPLRGVTAEISSPNAKTKLFFVYNNTPRTDVTTTNEEGALGFFNVPVGPVLVTVSDAATKAKIGQTSVVSRAGELSLVYLSPSP